MKKVHIHRNTTAILQSMFNSLNYAHNFQNYVYFVFGFENPLRFLFYIKSTNGIFHDKHHTHIFTLCTAFHFKATDDCSFG